ncbi:MAG TPA: aminodeoxychorismate synthase component I [Thermoanaerobaculia bacterium]|nr:aminodeoxychorismate synthase component I [Thermoanaerobaculia bacterium]
MVTSVAAVFVLRSGDALVFSSPLEVLVAEGVGDVLPVLRRVDEALRDGGWVAGMLAYEAAPAFDPALRTCLPGPLPLAWLAVYAAPRRMPLLDALGGLGAATDQAADVAWTPSLDAASYADRVARVRDAIARGDTYQVNLTQRLRAPFSGSPQALFASLLAAQPVPHAAYLDLGDHAICSASPELFFRRRGRLVVCRPMKGTAPRGRWPAEDARRAAALAASPKERAENLMIVDMVRNDLGRVARAGTVVTRDLFSCERYATLWQLTSTVTAQSDAPLSAVLAALFPSASVTGAPKARTMELIAALEGEPRGVYTGTIGWAGPGGRAHFNVAIRTVWIDRRRGIAEYGTGGGVTWDSDAAAEHAESRLKASVLVQPRADFELLETLRWSPVRGYVRLEGHLRRLAASARYFGFRRDGREWSALVDLARTLPPAPHRVRLRLARDGAVHVEAEPLAAAKHAPRKPRKRWRVALASTPVDAAEPLLFHKTTRRALYDAARAARPDCDDVLLWNERGELTESTIANLVVHIDGKLVTPPLECGLLPGVFRERLLARHRIAERVVRREDLLRASGLWLVSSLRGWRACDVVKC